MVCSGAELCYTIRVDIEWLSHARERLHERGLNEQLVDEAIRAPQQVCGRGPQKVFQKRYVDPVRQKEYLLRVFVEIRKGKVIVRSAYRTSKISKYWRPE